MIPANNPTAKASKHTIPMEVVVGTYEQYLIGYKVMVTNDGVSLERSFTDHAHNGSIRSVGASDCLIASGGTDENIRLFNCVKRADVGTLSQQEGTIGCLQFFQSAHMFSGSDDGTICVWETKRWECLKTLRGHKDAITSLSVHPSGKLLLSVSKDKTLRTWNLVKGRCAYITNLKVTAELVSWSPSGDHFVVVIDRKVDFYSTESADIISSYEFSKRISSIVFLNEDTVAIAGDCDSLEVVSLKGNKCLHKFKAHDNRIKSLFSTFGRITNKGDGDTDHPVWLFTLSSDGFLKLWNIVDMTKDPVLLTSVDTTCRPTSCSVVIPKGISLRDALPSLSNEQGKVAKKQEQSSLTASNSKKRKRT